MYKIVGVGSWDKFDQAPAQLVKVSGRGLVGQDRKDFLEKRAADHVFADMLDDIKLADGDVPIHLLAIGSTEGYGPNRNGDGFAEKTCRKTHDRFVKLANYFRHHKNKDPEQRYGKVKLSAYNPGMQRVELLLIGNGTKKAARRNGGLVMPSETREKLERGDDLGFSMACKVAHDVCSNCGNKAASRREYCIEDTCINPQTGFRGFGCQDGLSKVAENGFQQYVDNPDPFFFDISEVIRPADRIAYGGKATYLEKAASGRVLGGAELAEIWLPNQAQGPLAGSNMTKTLQRQAYMVRLAQDLAAIEQRLETCQTEDDRALARAVSPSMQPPGNLTPLGALGSIKMAAGLAALVGQKIVLPLRDFLRLATGDDAEKVASLSAKVSAHLPGIYTRMIADGALDRCTRDNPMNPAYGSPPNFQTQWAAKLAADYSLEREAVRERIQRSVIRETSQPVLKLTGETIKTAAADEPAESVARRYAAYKLAFLAALPPEEVDLPLTLELVILQNSM